MSKTFTKFFYAFLSLTILLSVVMPVFAQYNTTVVDNGGFVAVTKDASNNIYATKFNNGTGLYDVVKYTNGTGTGTPIYSGLTSEAGDYPWGLAVTSNGDVYLTTDFTDGAGNIIKLTKSSGYAASTFKTGNFYTAITVDASDNLYVTEYDGSNYAVVKYTTAGASATLYSGLTAQPGYSYPTGICIAPNGDIYVTDGFDSNVPDGGKIVKLTNSGGSYTASTLLSGNYYTSLAMDSSGNLYTTEVTAAGSNMYKLVKYANAGTTGTTLYASLEYDGGFLYPWGLTYVDASAIYAASANSTGDLLKLSPPNIPPTLVASGGTTAFTEGNNITSVPVIVDGGITVSDPDNTTFSSATVSISANFASGEDVLAFTNNGSTMGNITGSYVSGTGILTLTSSGSTATLAQWQAALRAVTYTNSSSSPNTSSRTISLILNDGISSSSAVTKNVSVTAVNDLPVISTSSGTTAFTEGNNITSVPVIVDAGITVSDLDNTTFTSATASISANFASGQDVLAFTNNGSTMGNVTGSYNASTGVLTLTSAGGTATQTQWREALRAIAYTNTSDIPGTANRTIDFVLGDGSGNSAPSSKIVSVTAINDNPVVLSSGGTVSYTENAAALTIDNTLTVSDSDNSNINSATVSITANYNSAQDVLSFTNQNGITGAFNAGTGVLSLSGTASVTNYQLALRSVKYNNTSENPSISNRTISFLVNDGNANSAVSTLTIEVKSVNDVPAFAKGSDESVLEDAGAQSVSGWATGISSGPADESGQTLSFTVTNDNNSLFSSQPALAADGTLSYTAAANASGTATVSVKLKDNGGTANGGVDETTAQTFTITVTGVNDVPVFAKGSDESVLEDAGAQSVSGWATGISSGPADESGQTLSFTVTNDNNSLFSSQPALAADGTLSYTAAANASGTATVSVKLKDNGGTANGGVDETTAQTFTITVTGVNDVPVFAKGSDESLLEDAGAQSVSGWATGISSGPADESGQTLGFTVTNDNNSLFSSQPALAADGTLSYTAAANASGTATVSVKLKDNGGTANGGVDETTAQTFTITVTGVNDVPVFTKGPDQSVLEDAGAQSVSGWATGISSGPADESGQTLGFTVTNDNNSLFGSQPAVAADGTLSYTAAANASGTATVSVKLQDNGGTANGGVDETTAQTFTITVTGVNDVPVFTKGPDQSVLEDAGAQSVSGWATGISSGPADESGQTLSFTVTNDNNSLFSSQPALAADGTLSYTAAANASGTATVSVKLKDNGGTANGGVDETTAQTFTITVTGVNDVPVFAKGSDESVLEDAGAQSVSGWATGISSGPADESGQTLSFTVTNDNNSLFSSQPALAADGTLSYTAAANASGTATVSVKLKDNGGTANGGVDETTAQTFTITVTGVNDVPVFAKGSDESVLEDAGAQSVSGWATGISSGPADESGQTLSFTVTNDNNSLFSSQPALAADGTLSYTAAANASGTATVSVKLKDNGGTANGGVDETTAQTFTITVTGVNDVPVFTKGPDQSVLEDAGAQSVSGWATGISSGPADESGQTLSFTVTNDNNSLFSSQPALAADGTLSYTAAANASGTATVSVKLQDNGGTANGGVDETTTQTFTISVGSVNNVPVFTKGSDQSVLEDAGAQSVSGWATGISSGPADESGQTLSFTVTNDNNSLFSSQPALAADGTLSYTAAANASGTATVSVKLKDNGGTANGGVDETTAQTFTIDIIPVNDTPVITSNGGGNNADLSIAENTLNVTTVIASDIEANPITYSISGGTDGAKFSIDANSGALSFISSPDYENPADADGNNTYFVNVQATDGTDAITQVLTLTVTDLNDNVPVITSANAVAAVENDIAAITVQATDADGGTIFTYSIVSGADAAEFSIDANSGALNFVYEPDYENPGDADGNNIYTVNVQVTDGTNVTTQALAITITDLNDSTPLFTSVNTASVSENSTIITTVQATDADAGTVLTYSISGGTDASKFSIDANSGAVHFISASDYESPADADGNNTYIVEVKASDGVNVATQILTVAITDLNDNAPVISNQSFDINENSKAEAILGTLSATDVDNTPASFTWSIVSGNESNVFSINSLNGVLSVNSPLDYENKSSYNLGIVLSDGLNSSSTQLIKVSVNDLPEVPLSIIFSENPLYENQVLGTLAGTLRSTSTDSNVTYTYSLVGTDNDNALFTINSDKVITSSILNFEQKASYKIRVRSTTQYGFYLEKDFVITIRDINEIPTLNPIANQTICYTRAMQTVPLTGISAGEDKGQTARLTVSASNKDLFSQLTIHPLGNGSCELKYQLQNGASGTATVTITVADNSGTANGGIETNSRSFTITVNPLPVASIVSDSGAELSKGIEARLTASGGTSYQWYDADGIISGKNTATLTVRPAHTTTYRVKVSNESGCSSEQEFTVYVKDNYTVLDINNIMTPNGDGVNDFLVIKNIDMYPNNEVKVYDRAGRLLYSRKNYTNDWDATFNGSPLVEDTYFYVVDFGAGIGKIKGFVTIVRE